MAIQAERGREVAAHGVHPEPVAQLAEGEERRLMELQIRQDEQFAGTRPPL